MNYYGTARTNTFRVRDLNAFKHDLTRIPGITMVQDGTPDAPVKLLFDEGIPCSIATNSVEGEEEPDYDDLDLIRWLFPHLADGEVAIVTESGHEGMRYVTGCAWAVNSEGATRAVSIDDIYDLAEELQRPGGPAITRAEY